VVAITPVALALRARGEGGWLAERIQRALREEPVEVLEAALAAADRRTRRAAYTAGIAASRLDHDQLLGAAQRDDDVLVRIACAVAVIRMSADSGRLHDVRPLLTNRASQVRAEAVFALAGAGELGPAEFALADRSPAVRAVAQAAVQNAGIDPAERYRVLAAKTPPDPVALAGLGEVGASSDVGLVMEWLHHPLSRGRVEAVRAARRLGFASPPVLLPLLTDPSPAVTRQVVLALRRRPGNIDGAALQALMRPPHAIHVRRAAHGLLRECGPWVRLAADLQVIATDPATSLRELALTDLDQWLTYTAATAYADLDGAVHAELLALAEAARTRLGGTRIRLLLFHVRSRNA